MFKLTRCVNEARTLRAPASSPKSALPNIRSTRDEWGAEEDAVGGGENEEVGDEEEAEEEAGALRGGRRRKEEEREVYGRGGGE